MHLLEGIIRLGSLQTSFLTLDSALKLTNRVSLLSLQLQWY